MSADACRAEVERLKALEIPLSETVRLHMHPPDSQQLAPCCAAALATLRGNIIAQAAKVGEDLQGVLSYLQDHFSWGVVRADFLCDMMKHSLELDCGSCTAIALFALDLFIEYAASLDSERRISPSSVAGGLRGGGVDGAPVQLAVVEVVQRMDPADMVLAMGKLREKYGASAADVYGLWIEDNHCYHKCPGLYSVSPFCNYLALWDFSTWLTPPHGHASAKRGGAPLHSLVAVRLTPYQPRNSAALAVPDHVMWEGKIRVRFNTWEDIGAHLAPSATPSCALAIPMGAFLRKETFQPILPASCAHSTMSTCSGSAGPMLPAATKVSSVTGADLRVFVSGCHMSVNPMPGVGVARAIRAWFDAAAETETAAACRKNECQHFKYLTLVGVDDAYYDAMSGVTDPVFDSARSLQALGYLQRRRFCDDHLYHSNLDENNNEMPLNVTISNRTSIQLEDQALWDAIVDMITPPPRFADTLDVFERRCAGVLDGDVALRLPQATDFYEDQNEALETVSFYMPCSDLEVSFLASRISWVDSLSGDSVCKGLTYERYCMAAAKIICPPAAALELTSKPMIAGAVSMGCFKIPEHYLIPLSAAASVTMGDDLSALQCICDTFGYPVLVKGVQLGAVLCRQWSQVLRSIDDHSDSRHRQQQLIQRYIPGCEKGIAFAAVHGKLTGCIMMTKHVTTYEGKVWAGRVAPVPADVVVKLSEFVASCNWTGGGELEFIETIDTALSGSRSWYIIDFNTRLPAWVFAATHAGCNLPGDLVHHMSIYHQFEGETEWCLDAYLSFIECDFVKSVIEVPVSNIDNGRKCSVYSAALGPVGKGSRITESSNEAASSLTPRCDASFESSPLGHYGGHSVSNMAGNPIDAVNMGVKLDISLQLVSEAANIAIANLLASDRKSGCTNTPMYVLSKAVFSGALKQNEIFFRQCAEKVQLVKGEAATSGGSMLHLQMALSVKTQPQREVLRAARQLGYLAECISMAEVRVALEVGFATEDIILTGPGKFWDTISEEEMLTLGLFSNGTAFAGIYADSAADLLSIVHRINDKDDWLNASLIGIRFQPFGNHSKSRFGVDATNPQMLCAVADIVRRLFPENMKLGVHLHFAASAPGAGVPAWFGMAKASANLATDFSRLCGRPLSVLDFGGGFPSHFIDSPLASQGLRSLFHYTREQCLVSKCFVGSAAASDGFSFTTIQFELGKSVTERSGGLLCSILAIREVDVDILHQYRGDSTSTRMISPERVQLDIELGGVVQKYAIVVDACVGDIGDFSHVHPIFWRPREKNKDLNWIPLSPGKNEIWGRTCMEFDVLVGSSGGWGIASGSCGTGMRGVSLPNDIKVGDLILIGCSGAYDMSMQYDFGDGIGRKKCFVH